MYRRAFLESLTLGEIEARAHEGDGFARCLLEEWGII